MNRRRFLSASAFALGGAFVAGCGDGADYDGAAPAEDETAAAGTASLERIGVQLYTVRSLMAQDVRQTLADVAAAGYDEVEFAGYFDHEPAEIRAMLDEVGLAAPSVHVPYGTLRDDLAGVLAAAEAVGHGYVVCPWLDESQRQTLDQYGEHAAFFNEVGQACQEAGIQFAYHNHEFEFVPIDGRRPYDLLLAETDPDLVQMELDLYWIAVAGLDPLVYFETHPGRFPLCHVKDRSAGGEMVAVGDGALDFAVAFRAAGQAGLRHYFVEHDNPDDPLDLIRRSHAYLAGLTF